MLLLANNSLQFLWQMSIELSKTRQNKIMISDLSDSQAFLFAHPYRETENARDECLLFSDHKDIFPFKMTSCQQTFKCYFKLICPNK